MSRERQLMWAIIKAAPNQITAETGSEKPSNPRFEQAINELNQLRPRESHPNPNWGKAIEELSRTENLPNLFKLTYCFMRYVKNRTTEPLFRGTTLGSVCALLYKAYMKKSNFNIYATSDLNIPPEFQALHKLMYDQHLSIRSTPENEGKACSVEIHFAMDRNKQPLPALTKAITVQSKNPSFEITLPASILPEGLEGSDLEKLNFEEKKSEDRAEKIESLSIQLIDPIQQKKAFLSTLKGQLNVPRKWEALGHGLFGTHTPDGITQLKNIVNDDVALNKESINEAFNQVQNILRNKKEPHSFDFFGLRKREDSVATFYKDQYKNSLAPFHDYKMKTLKKLAAELELSKWDRCGKTLFGGETIPDGIVKMRAALNSLNYDDVEEVQKAFSKVHQIANKKQGPPSWSFLGIRRRGDVQELYKKYHEATKVDYRTEKESKKSPSK